MKYLYKILRLFICPHRYTQKERIETVNHLIGNVMQIDYVKECRYCGKIRNFRGISL
jgi:hypothetical protein